MKKLIVALLCLAQLPLFAGQPAAQTNNSRTGIYVGAGLVGAGIAAYTAINMIKARKDLPKKDKKWSTPSAKKAYKAKQFKLAAIGLAGLAATAGICLRLNHIDKCNRSSVVGPQVHPQNGRLALAGLGAAGFMLPFLSYKVAKGRVRPI